MRKDRGFTLIELVIVVAIIGILVAIAFPSYQTHLRKGRRAEAQSVLMDAANKEQQYLLDARAYALGSTALATLGVVPPYTVANFYTITVMPAAATTPPTFTITATPVATSAQAPDGVLTIDNTGQKTLAGNPGW